MGDFYIVRAVPVRDERGAVAGWLRADVLADGADPTGVLFLRDGSACGEAEAIKRIAANPALLYRTRAGAVREGIKRLREASHT